MQCNGCGTDWTGHAEAYPQLKHLNKIDICPECPEAGVEGHEPISDDISDAT